MDEFLKQIAGILEVESVTESDAFKSFPQWDSLSVLSVIAMMDSSYGVHLLASDLQKTVTVGDLWRLVPSRKTL